jgi:hypothetical protein
MSIDRARCSPISEFLAKPDGYFVSSPRDGRRDDRRRRARVRNFSRIGDPAAETENAGGADYFLSAARRTPRSEAVHINSVSSRIQGPRLMALSNAAAQPSQELFCIL